MVCLDSKQGMEFVFKNSQGKVIVPKVLILFSAGYVSTPVMPYPCVGSTDMMWFRVEGEAYQTRTRLSIPLHLFLLHHSITTTFYK